jgi:signal transduction histidine kinase
VKILLRHITTAAFSFLLSSSALADMGVWEDSTGAATIADVMANADRLFDESREIPRGSTASNWWLRTQLVNLGDLPATQYIAVEGTQPQRVIAFDQLVDGSIREQLTGRAVSAAERSVASSIPSFRYRLDPGETRDVFLRFSANELINVDVSVLSETDAVFLNARYNYQFAAILSALFVFFAIMISRFISTREWVFGLYAIYIALVSIGAADRFAGLYFLTGIEILGSVQLIYISSAISMYVFGACVFLIYKDFHFNGVKELLNLTLIGVMFLCLMAVVNPELAARLVGTTVGIALVGIMTMLVWIPFRARAPLSRQVFFGWSLAFAGYGGAVLNHSGVVGSIGNGLIIYGLSAEILVFTLLFFETYRLQVDEQRRREQESLRLEHTMQLASIGEMTATVTHEIQQPLSVIKLTVANVKRLISKVSLDDIDAVTERLDRITAMADRTNRLTEHIRRSSRVATDRSQVSNLWDSIESCKMMLSERLIEHQVRLDAELPEDLPSIRLHPLSLDQVILNVMKNAVDAMADLSSDDKSIQITASKASDNRVSITIEDLGGGIPEDALPHIFDRFFTTKGAVKGTGIGLSYVKALVTEAGGAITAGNTSLGARFEILLPHV